MRRRALPILSLLVVCLSAEVGLSQSCPPTGVGATLRAEVSQFSNFCVLTVTGPAQATGTLSIAAFEFPMISPFPIQPGLIAAPFVLDCGGKFEVSVPLSLMASLVDVHGDLSVHMQAVLDVPPLVGSVSSEIWTVQVCRTSAAVPVYQPRIGGSETLPGGNSVRTWATFVDPGLGLGGPEQYLIQASPFAFQYLACPAPNGIEGLLPVNGQ